MIRIYLVRHGQTVENTKHILQGHMAGHLTETGRKQMKQLGETFANTHIDYILCSNLQRAFDSALCMNLPLPIKTTPLLRERDWGVLTGYKIETVKDTESFPSSVESIEQMYHRAALFIGYLFDHYNGKSLLCVGHGLFNRFIVAVAYGKPYYEIPRFENSGFQMLEIEKRQESTPHATSHKDEASAN